jgi:hypothetical protein
VAQTKGRALALGNGGFNFGLHWLLISIGGIALASTLGLCSID